MRDTVNRRDFLKQTAGVSLVAFASRPRLSAVQHALERDRYLLIDSRNVEHTENARLTPGTVHKHAGNPLFSEDKPWEKRIDNVYANVMYDEQDQLYKCWYSPFIIDDSARGMSAAERATPYDPPRNREMAICYATSRDGLSWEKPELGLVKYEGSTANNILWRGSQPTGREWYDPHGTGIFKDLSDPDPKRRYKAFLKGDILSVAFSSDGIHWSPALHCPEADVRGDTHNNAYWAPTLGRFVGMTRRWGEARGRQVARTTSPDFVNWTRSEVVLEGLTKRFQTYAMPVFYHAGVYLGLLALYDAEADRTWTELTWSPDTETWHRVSAGTPLIPNADEEGAYDWGCVYAAATPVFLEDEIRLYYGGSDGYHFGWRNGFFCLARLRPDGFAGYGQQDNGRPAVVTTGLIAVRAGVLAVSADVATSGHVEVTVLDDEGAPLAVSERIAATVTDTEVRWRNGYSLATGSDIRLRFELSGAKLYSFSFI